MNNELGYYYLIPLIIGVLWVLLQLMLNQTMRHDRPFDNDYSNALYNMSFLIPFRWFIEEDRRAKKAVEMNDLIVDARMDSKLDYRSSVVLQFILMFLGVVLFLMLSIIVKPAMLFFGMLTNLDFTQMFEEGSSAALMIRLVLVAICTIPSILMKPMLKKRTKGSEIDFLKDLPLLQLFIILMLRSNKTINQVLYVLSSTNTAYRRTFEHAYRIYLREPNEGFDYLEDAFDGTKMLDTIYTLRDFAEYDKKESIRSLENNQESILDFSRNARKKVEANRNLMATVSQAFPMLAVMALAVGPVAYWAIGLMQTSGLN